MTGATRPDIPAVPVPSATATGPAGDVREALGRLVHAERLAVNAAKERPFGLLPWEGRTEEQRELDMRIGDAVAAAERERIRRLAGAVNATCDGDGIEYPFADLLGQPAPEGRS